MTILEPAAPFRLETTWTPAAAGESLAYALTLINQSGEPAKDFRLCVSGPARMDPAAVIEGGTLAARLSNHSEFAPPKNFVLAPGASWTVTARGLSYPLRHWTDGANSAYLAFADGTTTPVATVPTRNLADGAPLKRGAEIFPVPEIAPVPISVVPWPNEVSVAGRRAVPPGLDLRPQGEAAQAAAAAFGEIVETLFAVEGIVRPSAEGGLPVQLSIADGHGPEGYGLRFEPGSMSMSSPPRAPACSTGSSPWGRSCVARAGTRRPFSSRRKAKSWMRRRSAGAAPISTWRASSTARPRSRNS